MKKFVNLLIVAVMLVSALSGCKSAEVSTTVATDGSTSMEKVIGFLSESYMQANPDVKVTYNPTGSGAGIQAVMSGRCDIGLSSRELTADEAQNMTATVVAIDGIAVIVNPQNPVTELSLEAIAKIYTGEIKSWNEVGGPNSPIVVIGREAASGTRDGFEAITETEDMCKYTQELTSTGDIVQTVASNPNAIGYASVASVKDTVKPLSVDGVSPSTETIQNGQYKIQRNFILVTNNNNSPSDSVRDFLSFATSAEADELIISAGAVPVKR